MKRLVLLALAMCTGCSEPVVRLKLEFSDPTLRPAWVTLRVLQPVNPQFSCDHLALRAIPEIVQLVVEQKKIRFELGAEVRLPEVPRAGTHLLVLDGFDAAGAPMVAGCAVLNEASTAVTMKVEPVVHVEAGATPNWLVVPSDGGVASFPVLLRDALERPANGIEARWFLAGMGTASGSGPIAASVDGGLKVIIDAQARRGPFTVSVAPRWGLSIPLVLGMVAPTWQPIQALPEPLEYVSGRLGPAGEPGFAALLTSGGGTAPIVVWSGPGGSRTAGPRPPIPGPRHLGLFENPDGGRDRAVSVGRSSFEELSPDASTPRPAWPVGVEDPEVVFPAWPTIADACAQPASQVAVRFPSGARVFDRDGAEVLGHPLGQKAFGILASGCLSDRDGSTLPAVVADLSTAGYRVLRFEAGKVVDVATLLGLPAALGWAGAGNSRELLATRVDRNRFLVSRLRVGSRGLEGDLDAPGELPLTLPPFDTASADFDGDGTPDLAALLGGEVATDAGRVQAFFVLVWLGREVKEQLGLRTVAGVLPLPALCSPDLWTQDFDRDGRPDLVVAERAPCSHEATISFYSFAP